MLSLALASDLTTDASSATSSLVSLLPMVAIFAVFYFLLIRPQMKKQKQLNAMIDALKKGDQVIAAGGIIGKVIKVEEKVAYIEIAPDVKIKVAKSAISEILNDLKTENDSKEEHNSKKEEQTSTKKTKAKKTDKK
jgi:preprotein translocase subunit YajC